MLVHLAMHVTRALYQIAAIVKSFRACRLQPEGASP